MNFEETYRIYFQNVYRFLFSLTGNADLSQELTQETFFKAMGAMDRFDGRKDILAWLFTIARNTYYSHCRKQKYLTSDSMAAEPFPEDSVPAADSPAETLIRKETALEIHRFLHNMKEPYKEVFTLRVLGELSYAQIGRLFGKSESWVRVTYYRAKKQIIAYMEGLDHE
ncbi:MAG: RNA polymerase sigma factor [Clostridia bacterium]|nr:RNA polymerase sigma factor [Clostridia bacterium]